MSNVNNIGISRPGARRFAKTTAALVGAAFVLAACGGSDAAAPEAPAAEVASASDGPTISIADFAFSTLDPVAAGSTVTVTNSDGAPHTLTAVDGGFDTGNVGGGESITFTAPSEPGIYEFFCAIHPNMTGQLVVN